MPSADPAHAAALPYVDVLLVTVTEVETRPVFDVLQAELATLAAANVAAAGYARSA